MVDVAVAYTEPERGQVVIPLLNEVIEKNLIIHEVLKFMATTPGKTTHATQIANPFDATQTELFH